MDYMLYY